MSAFPLALGVILAAAGCSSPKGQQSQADSDATDRPQVPSPLFTPSRVVPEPSGLHNVVRVNDRLFAGSEPHGSEGFASLAELGVKTIISVDGAKPDVEAARANGLRYVHIPIGYDGMSESAKFALVRAARDCDGPIYVHCHHGRHRGPAAAAVACMAVAAVSGPDALKLLEVAGTGKEYPGLWRDVESFAPPAPDATLPDLVETAQVKSLAAAMASLDRHWDNLKLCRDAGWKTPAEHPDLDPLQEALLLREGLHEALRTAPADRFDAPFREWLSDAETLAVRLEESLSDDADAAGETLTRLESACQRCHARYRN